VSKRSSFFSRSSASIRPRKRATLFERGRNPVFLQLEPSRSGWLQLGCLLRTWPSAGIQQHELYKRKTLS
jgi:hypothetical protein